MVLRPNSNIWRLTRAGRAAVLIDGAAYFGALRAAMVKARHSIDIAGWDIHSQMRLVGPAGKADDGYPETFSEFLTALVERRPELRINVLLWDFSVIYAAERDFFPTLALRWKTPSQVRFCLDDCVPLGSSQHQKIAVVDDALAFCGGLDVTTRRWDTSAHDIEHPQRTDSGGKTYSPFHDVQIMVDGEAARALGELVRARWSCAACEKLPQTQEGCDPWPDHVEADFADLDIGIARTHPRYEDQPEVREVERAYLDCIDAAEHSIYIENQFLTAPPIAERLAKRLEERPKLELLVVAPKSHDSWIEAHSMKVGREAFAKILRAAGGERVHLVFPKVTEGERSVATMVHSKVMIVDDRLLRIGSSNLNNRSMAVDTECDIIVPAQTAAQRRQIAAVRNRLIADHCGAKPAQVAVAIKEAGGSLIEVARMLSCNGHALTPIVDTPEESDEVVAVLQGVADPKRPFGAERFIGKLLGGVSWQNAGTILKIVGAGLAIIALALLWQYVPLAKPQAVRAAFSSLAGSPYAPVVVLACFVVAGFVMFPVTVLIAACAAAFGPWFGFAYATAGSLASALASYGVGVAIGKRPLRDFLGPRLNRIRRRVAKRGVIAVAAIRMVPISPFTVVNLVAGASGIPVMDYVAGTLLGMLPGLIAISAVGHQFARILTAPTPMDFALLAAAVIGWIGLSIGVQAAVSRYWSDAR